MKPDPISWWQVHWSIPLESPRALALLQRLATDVSRPRVVIEARGRGGQVKHFVGTERTYVARLSELFRTHAGASLVKAPHPRPALRTNARLRVEGQALPLAVERIDTAVRSALAALATAGPSEQVILQVVLGRGIAPMRIGPRPPEPSGALEGLLHATSTATADSARRLRDKASEPGLHATVRLSAESGHLARERQLVEGVLGALRTLQSPGTFVRLASESPLRAQNGTSPNWRSLRLATPELLAIIGWPLDYESLPGMPPAHPKLLALPSTVDQTRPFAAGTHPATPKLFGQGIQDALVHTSVVGPTGSGKSTVLLNLIRADLEAGRSVVVVDPKSDLVRDVLSIMPKERRGDVVMIDPTDERPVGLNPLQPATAVAPELVADGILTIFRDLYPTLFGPRTADVLYSSLLALAETRGATLAWLPRLLGDPRQRAEILGRMSLSEEAAEFWAAWEAMGERQQAQHAGPVLSRLRQYLNRPSLRRVLDQAQPRFDMAELFTSPKVLLVPLNSALLGTDAARLLGALVVSRIWNLTLARSVVPPEERSPVSIVIDEAAQFVRLGDLADALAMSRSYGAAWTLAYQYRDQFAPAVRAAVDANALTTVVFNVGQKDARDFGAMATELTEEDFKSLGAHEIYVQLVQGGHRIGWASGRTLPKPPALSDPGELIRLSRQRYGREDDPASAISTSQSDTAIDASARPPAIGRRKRRPQ